MKRPVYLDNHATTRTDPRVVEAMLPYFTEHFGNAASRSHAFGWEAEEAVETARGQIAEIIGASAKEVIFTSGATEANNLALKGFTARASGRHVVTSAAEHVSVLTSCRELEKRGWRVTYVGVDADGRVDPEAVTRALADDTALVSVMHANNEIGTIQPIAELARLARTRGALFHTDAVQSVAKIPVDVRALGVDLLSLSAHKFNGPKGAGALWIRRGTRLTSILTGGKHERTRRAGTENVAAIAGLGAAARLAQSAPVEKAVRLGALRDRLESEILARIPGTTINGSVEARVPNTTNISFENIEAESLLIALDLAGIAVSTGSACSSGALEPSHVLKAMGFPLHRTQNSIRFSLGASNTEEEIDRVAALLPGIVQRLRQVTAGRATQQTPASA